MGEGVNGRQGDKETRGHGEGENGQQGGQLSATIGCWNFRSSSKHGCLLA